MEPDLNLKLDEGTKPLSSPVLLNAAGAGLDKMLTRASGKCFTGPCISQINSTMLEGVQIKWLKDSPAESDSIIIYAGEDRFSRLTFIWPRCTLRISHLGTIANLMMSDTSCKEKSHKKLVLLLFHQLDEFCYGSVLFLLLCRSL